MLLNFLFANQYQSELFRNEGSNTALENSQRYFVSLFARLIF